MPSLRPSLVASFVGLCALSAGVTARAEDPACAARFATGRLNFAARDAVDFGPGFMGEAGSSNLGIRYNFLLLGDYDWAMNGQLRVTWPRAFMASALGDTNGGRLTVQYGLRLQFWLRLFGAEYMIPVPVWAGVDRSERGMSTFTPWAWDPAPTAVTVNAHERLLRQDSVTTPLGVVNYWIYGSYELTTTVRTVEMTLPQGMAAITQSMPEVRFPPLRNGDMDVAVRQAAALRYQGAVRLRVEVDYPLCLPALPCTRRRDTIFNEPIPFASRTEQQVQVDRQVHLSLPGLEVMPGTEVSFGTVRLGFSRREDITIRNPGSATMAITPMRIGDPHFQLGATDTLCVAGGSSRTLTVRFIPDMPGHFETDLVIGSTSPVGSETRIHLVADATGGSTLPQDGGVVTTDGGIPPEEHDAGLPMKADGGVSGDGGEVLMEEPGGGCGCRAGGGERSSRAWGVFVVFALGVASRRRRRAVTRPG